MAAASEQKLILFPDASRDCPSGAQCSPPPPPSLVAELSSPSEDRVSSLTRGAAPELLCRPPRRTCTTLLGTLRCFGPRGLQQTKSASRPPQRWPGVTCLSNPLFLEWRDKGRAEMAFWRPYRRENGRCLAASSESGPVDASQASRARLLLLLLASTRAGVTLYQSRSPARFGIPSPSTSFDSLYSR
jgi:hypothetical protein